MSTVQLDVRVDVADAVRRLAQARARFDAGAYLRLVGNRLLAWVDENFRRAGAETPWRPLSPNTVAGRRRGQGSGGPQPLRDTGRMAQSFVYELLGDAVWVGTRDQKAVWHHLGTPAREITTAPQDRRARTSPTRPGALRFMTPAGPVFRRRVRHPGIPARPLLPTRSLAERLANDVLEAYVRHIATTLRHGTG
jgi:phage gpG-like protein